MREHDWITFSTTGIDGVEAPLVARMRPEDIRVIQANPDSTYTIVTSVLSHYVVSVETAGMIMEALGISNARTGAGDEVLSHS